MTTSQTIFRFLVGMLMSLSILFLDSVHWTGWLRGGIETVMKPELRAISSVSDGASQISGTIQFAVSGRGKLEAAEKELVAAQQQLLHEHDASKENETLKKVLGSASIQKGVRLVPARVLAHGATLIIENVNFSPGQTVLTPEGSLIGVVGDVGTWTANVRLITDARSTIGVSVVMDDGAETSGELHGSFGTSMTVEKVLSQFQLSRGLLVVTRGSDGIAPPRLLIGSIGSTVRHEESAVYQSASVEPALEFESLSTVMVMEPNAP